MMADYLRQLARYNRWANRRLLAACAELSEDDYKRDRRAFFGSIHRTLNHILQVGSAELSGYVNFFNVLLISHPRRKSRGYHMGTTRARFGALWRRIKAAIEQMQKRAPGDGDAIH